MGAAGGGCADGSSCATSSLPVPVSPVISTLVSEAASRASDDFTWRMAALTPTIAENGRNSSGDAALVPVRRRSESTSASVSTGAAK
jgi:hypothetical protein